ncbi:nicotinamidase [Citricoccus zhacaiensis]|uniref:Nicotinamidase n=1 Tax=Citricoccus zhacaiensis TaxID=489142 RepID=A0ABQ2LNC9_9MICC|nr:isochorismatase family cysteine hydrolase [Citricoccus zhacaiensis]GGO40791.1 nicotinamidase [Citricoccus zhacaiensis]
MTELSTAVVFIDLQEGFFEDPSSRDNRELMVAESNRLAGLARQAGIPLFVVSTVHARDKSTWTLKMLEDDQGFNFPGTPQVQLLDGLDLEAATHLEKIRDSAFHGTSLAQRLRTVGARTVILAGVTAESCIAATGRDAFAHDFRVVYAREAIASSTAEVGWPLLEGLCDTLRQQILNRPDLERLLTADG